MLGDGNMVNRKDFHHNFLKSIIVRLDFQVVLETEVEEKVLPHVKSFAKEKGFSRYLEKNIISQIDIALTNKETPESIATKNNVRNQKIYSFTDENRGFVLDISNTFVCLQINTVHYTPFDDYSDIVPSVSKFYMDNIYFFAVKRFGIRKINECLIEDKNKIQQFFNPSYFNFYNNIEAVNTIQSNHTDIFTCETCHVNFITNIAQVQLENKPQYKIHLDIDAYLDKSEDISLLLGEPAKMAEINDLIFKIYTSSLTDGFISSLISDDDFDSTVMIGVERND